MLNFSFCVLLSEVCQLMLLIMSSYVMLHCKLEFLLYILVYVYLVLKVAEEHGCWNRKFRLDISISKSLFRRWHKSEKRSTRIQSFTPNSTSMDSFSQSIHNRKSKIHEVLLERQVQDTSLFMNACFVVTRLCVAHLLANLPNARLYIHIRNVRGSRRYLSVNFN